MFWLDEHCIGELGIYGQVTRKNADEAYLWAASRNLQERILELEELAPMAALLASPESSGIKGQAISVDGGYKVFEMAFGEIRY